MKSSSSEKTVLIAGPVILLVAAIAYGFLDRNVSNDTWISLASGRYIFTEGLVPRTDPFSYTFQGEPWFNQNWLSHALIYLIHQAFGGNGVIVATWLATALIVLLVLLAIYNRSGSWLVATLASTVFAWAVHGYFPPRPDTLGTFCLAATVCLLSALAHHDGRHRRWPAVLLFPVFVFWGCAHGSFLFGYGLVGFFVLAYSVENVLRGHDSYVNRSQLVFSTLSCAAALLLTMMLGPYGMDNFTHPFKVASSPLFRVVSEWVPPYRYVRGSSVFSFWTSISAALLTAIVISRMARSGGNGTKESDTRNSRITISLFDGASLLLGLAMALWARRFIPLFFILALPGYVSGCMGSMKRIPGPLTQSCRNWILRIAGVAAVGLLGYIGWYVHSQYVSPYRTLPHFTLWQRALVLEETPFRMLEFMKRNGLHARLYTNYNTADQVIWEVPTTRVFIDGRIQQVYSESHLLDYGRVLIPDSRYGKSALNVLDKHGTDALLLYPDPDMATLMGFLDDLPDWIPVLHWNNWVLYLRKGSRPLKELIAKEREGAGWLPPTLALMQEGKVDHPAPSVLYQRTLYFYERAVQREPVLALERLDAMCDAWIALGRADRGRAFLSEQRDLLKAHDLPGYDDRSKEVLMDLIDRCERRLRGSGE